MKALSLFLTLVASLSAQMLYAATNIVVESPTKLLPHVGSDSGEIIAKIISYGIGLVGVLAVMAVTWAGIQMILASGDEEKTKKARTMIIYAFIGVIVAGLAYGAVKFITNVQLDTFR